MQQFKEWDTVVRRDGQIGVITGPPSKKTGKIPVCFDTEKPSRMTDPSHITLLR